MGLFDSFKGEVKRNFIARADDAKDVLVYKYPERNVRELTQLTVGADETVLFVKDGKIAGRLGAGRHSLEASNIPFLSALLEKVTGGNLFVSELFFVTTREVAGVKFGGPVGDVRDPETQLGIGTRVYGDFSLKVVNAERLVLGLLGLGRSENEDFMGWFRGQVLKVARDRIAELLVKKRWALLDVTSGAYTEEMEQEVLSGVKAHLDSYGVEVVRLGNFQISIKEEDEVTLKKLAKDTAYTKLAGGFQSYAQGQAFIGAGEGMAKGGGEGGGSAVLQGAGLAVGMAMANQQQPRAPTAADAGAAAGAGRTVAERLKDIAGLKEVGVLTEDEYQAKRAELIKLL